MSSITRSLPETYETMLEALGLAVNKRNSIAPAANPLTTATNTRLTNMLTQFNTQFNNIDVAKLAYTGNTPAKEAARINARLFISHFFQVFNLGVARGKYAAAQRSAFHLPVEGDSLPDLTRDADLLQWGKRIVDGDAVRTGNGGLPMVNPDATEVDAAVTAFLSAFTAQSNLKDSLDAQQEALEALWPEAEKVIKKVWDELETFYNEEDDDSRRENCREWGMVYITEGSNKTLSGTVTYNGAPGAGLTVRFKKGRNKSTTTATGAYSLTTTLMGNQEVVIERIDENNIVLQQWEFTVPLAEDENRMQNFTISD